MKKILLVLSLFSYSMFAEDAGGNYDTRGGTFVADQDETTTGPFFVNAHADHYFKSKLTKHNYKCQKMGVQDSFIELGMVYYYNECFNEGLTVSLAYDKFILGWDHNPYFEQQTFENGIITLGGFTERLPGWVWKGFISIQGDLDHHNFDLYTTYDFLLWGRFAYSECVGIHAGVYVETGLKLDRVYPVIGFDWKINQKWMLNAVFPMDVSLQYNQNDCLDYYVGLRFFDSRHRTGTDENLSKAVFRYGSTGLELGGEYRYNPWVSVNLHGGYTLSNNLKIADRHSDHSKHFKTESMPYLGGELTLRF